MSADGPDPGPAPVDTPAAHVETTARLAHVDAGVDTVDGTVRIHLRTDTIDALVFFAPEEARTLADDLTTAAERADE